MANFESKRSLLSFLVLLLGSIATTNTTAYFIEWMPPTPLSHAEFLNVQTATGPRPHTHDDGILANGLFLQSFTEVAASGGEIGGQNNFGNQETITRAFIIRRSTPDEELTVIATMKGLLQGRWTRSLEGFTTAVSSFYRYVAQVLGTGLKADGDDTFAIGRSGVVTVPVLDSEILAVDTIYTLELLLATSASSVWNGSTATSARMDFDDPDGAVELGDALRAEISVRAIPAPEPGTLALIAIGALALLGFRPMRTTRPS